MPSFPRKESDILALTMSNGYTANADGVALGNALNDYLAARNSQTDSLTELESILKQQLKQSELDVMDEPEKLELISWGPKASPTPATVPAQP